MHLELLAALRAHLQLVRRRACRDDGYTTETVIIIGLMAVLAISVGSVITDHVMGRAIGIDMG
ncbi:hypothetical protein E0L36_02280 [Streptomyces sp. AJS327]|uniref:hypothetical protein n=1 Tax=Streptomyces sp. AJS327 TaxID=2545265 RepID=UPI0015E03B81|nr:hypothetical protein [Streptomyces sp. AJS327]MBA0049771.1 hypothetical protein [Streptomyces sp. AJS327]